AVDMVADLVEDCEDHALAAKGTEFLSEMARDDVYVSRVVRILLNRLLLEAPELRIAALDAIRHISPLCRETADAIMGIGRVDTDGSVVVHSRLPMAVPDTLTDEDIDALALASVEHLDQPLSVSLMGYMADRVVETPSPFVSSKEASPQEAEEEEGDMQTRIERQREEESSVLMQ
ncbi:hypothetical protein KIPB_015236, partial [Kipferlia bialata]